MSSFNDQISLEQRIIDLANACRDKYAPGFTRFLDGSDLICAKSIASRYKQDVLCIEYGGFSCAERNVIGLFPRSIYDYQDSSSDFYEMFELCCLHIKGSGYRKFTHRDFLGSVMSLGVKREAVGDIYVDQDKTSAYAVFTKSVGEYILSELSSVANDKVTVIRILAKDLPQIKFEYSVINATVASFRLDCVLSASLGTSREKAKRLIDSKSVSVNHRETLRADCEIKEGDLLSVRGHGRFKINNLGDVTKKGRNRIEIHKLL